MTREQDSDGWAFSESKDWKDGRHRRENRFVSDEAGEVTDTRARRTLMKLRAAYRRQYRQGRLADDAPASVEDLNLYHDIREYYSSEAFADAVEEGDGQALRSHVGSQNDEVDVSGWHDIETVREIATEQHLRLYEFGEPGTGKTSAGCLVARHWLQERREEGHTDARVLTNIRSLAEQVDACIYVGSWPALQARFEEKMSDVLDENVTPFLFLFDEASSQASGGKDGYEASTKLATLVYKIRKYGGALIIIGHDGKDVHPSIRLLCTVLEKESKKQARFYNTVKNRKGKDPITPEITGWPDSKWSPNDKDPAPWSWSDDANEESADSDGHIAREEAYREMAIWTVINERTGSGQPLSFEKIADRRLDGLFSAEWCRQRWNEYDGGQHGEVVGNVTEAIG